MRIAVIGSGISGLGSAYLLSQKHDVHLFEASSRLGGHANTVQTETAKGRIPMDTGFLVYNELTYPHLKGMFAHLNVETVASDMSLSIRVDEKKLEWNGQNFNTIFGQRKNLLKPSFYFMLLEINRFHKEVENNRQMSLRQAWTLGELLKERKFSKDFCNDYLLPMSAAIWSTPEQDMMAFPAAPFLTFLINHKLVQVENRPIWRTVLGGSIQYVDKIAKKLPHIHLNAPVLHVERVNGQVQVKTASQDLLFDKVVFATHAPVTAQILKFENELEAQVLNSFRVEKNTAILHQDLNVMPREKRTWASWNVRGQSEAAKVTLSYYLNRLQPLKTEQDYFLTLNPKEKIKNQILELNYDHPQFDQTALRAQRQLPEIQGVGGIYFAGAWTRYGFHEDGLLSAVRVAELMGIKTPWQVL